MNKVGFLLPRSTVYPLAGFDFLDGYKSYLKHLNIEDNITIVTENIGFGLDEEEVYSKNEKLLLQENVDVVVAFIDGRCAEMLTPLYNATGKILVLVNIGAHYSFEANSSPNIIHLTFNEAFNCWLTGKLAATENNKIATMATSFYDGGYLHCFAMVNSYNQNGGAITNNFISHFKPELFDTTPLELHIENNADANTILNLFSGDVAHLLLPALSTMQQKQQINLYFSPMLFDETVKQKMPDKIDIKNAKGFSAWVPNLPNEINIEFKKQFNQLNGREATPFALLGWEAGILLNEIDAAKQLGLSNNDAIKTLQDKKLSSPRGWIELDGQTNQVFSSAYLITCKGNFELTIEDTMTDIAEEKTKFINTKVDELHSSWRNTYLCS
jgi:branched-chain amino acid transport system substrate-binding protein